MLKFWSVRFAASIQICKSICTIARTFTVCSDVVSERIKKILWDRLVHLERCSAQMGNNPAAKLLTAPVCKEGQEKECQNSSKWSLEGHFCAWFCQNCQTETPQGWVSVSTSTSCAHSPETCSLAGIYQKTSELADSSLMQFASLHDPQTWIQVSTSGHFAS